MLNRKLLLASFFLLSPLCGEEFEVNLKNPVFSHGVITTDEGGIITAPGIRIQARKISYTNRIENGVAVQRVEAEGDLMMEYGEHAFVGTKLEYDLASKTGMLWDGKTFVDIWFLGGSKIQLTADGSYTIYDAYVTTCESQDHTWDIHARSVRIDNEHLLSARNIRFRFAKIPIFWLPSFKSNLTFLKDSPVRYKVKWDKSLGPRVTMRYRFFSWEHFHAYLRLDYRITRGPGMAIETDYRPSHKRTVFRTRSYGAYDKSWPDEHGNKRYRLQGLYETKTENEKTFVHMTYDKLSDEKMPGDFKSQDFEVNTQKRTRLLVSHHERQLLSSFSFQPRINSFQTINQELPYVTSNIRPFKLGPTGLIFDNYFNAGYLDYVFADHTSKLLTSQRAGRLETHNQVYRPFKLAHLTITPEAGFIGIYYSNNLRHRSTSQTLFSYGGTAATRFYRSYGDIQHMVEPYARYEGLTKPSTGIDNHFYFNMDDGYAKLNLLRLGVKNTIFSAKASPFLPPLTTDLFTYAYFDDHTYKRTFPKYYFNVGWNRPSYNVVGGIAWNQEERVWDFTNLRTAITISADLAFGFEIRHRSKFDWRKADHESFILDVARPIEELVESPLSDRRNTVLFKLYGRLMPGLTCLLQSHHGWHRRKEPPYHEFKIEVFKMLTCSWQAKFGYQYALNDPFQVTAGIQLVK